jgi:hypothetical protein
LFVVLLITAPSYLEVGASDKPGAVHTRLLEATLVEALAPNSRVLGYHGEKQQELSPND